MNDKKISLIISIGIHILLLLIFLIIKFNFEIFVPEFIEISFKKGGEVEAAQVSEVKQTTPIIQKEVREFETRNIDIPSRPEVEPADGKLNIETRSKLIPDTEINVIDAMSGENFAPESQASPLDAEKEIADFSLNSKISPESIVEPGSGSESPFEIEGKAAQRSILTKVIPQYPENLQQEAIVKIRFTVLPNGLVGEMIPIIKGNDLLERISLDAFKQWRFSPLPPNVAQIAEQGTITFKYFLK